MSVQVYGCNHVAIEVGDIKKAVEFYQDLFRLKKLDEGEGDAFFKLGEHQFLAMFERKNMRADASDRHFGIMVRDANQVAEVRDKLTKKYKIELIPPFGCDFRDPWGNRIQVVDLHDESLVWLLPYPKGQSRHPERRVFVFTEGKWSIDQFYRWLNGNAMRSSSRVLATSDRRDSLWLAQETEIDVC
jgi:catechol 2,3-dioxygenase-like lactoylglutathione lyase family enzyme